MSVASTILDQLGGINKVSIMTGATNLVSDYNSIVFNLPTKYAKGKRNKIIIVLEQDDLYTMEWIAFDRSYSMTTIKKVSGIYAEDMRSVFTAMTGLDTVL